MEKKKTHLIYKISFIQNKNTKCPNHFFLSDSDHAYEEIRLTYPIHRQLEPLRDSSESIYNRSSYSPENLY